MKKVMIATPTLDGKLDVHYVDSLMNTRMLGLQNDIDVVPLFIAHDALIQRVRNDLMWYAHNADIDAMVFIDSDEGWRAEDFIKIVNNPEDVIGATCRKKIDQELYVLKVKGELPIIINEDNGLIELAGVGTGFLKLTKKAIDDLWESSESYFDNDVEKKMIFNVSIKDNDLVSEDITLCNKLTELGYKLWLDPTITCIHVGTKVYVGNFEDWARSNNIIKRA